MKPNQTVREPETEETERLEADVLKRLLSTPPQPKPKKADEASPPKKRGRPKKEV